MNYRQTILEFLDAGRLDLAEAYINISVKVALLADISAAVLERGSRDLVDTADLLEHVE